ncbi:hypothetical protein YH63_012525 [Afipia massiliensis]|uniref:Glycosyltransferase RgtA/B/C/D-like domain-containing protein n=1 Tax=Afipia massiliensis TaxID=211460 RepID=A0A4U6BP25_9BRAD|nr:hypothetical protein [Afipia massiliensis]TKT72179.1 hypothetical protein YH63_012525 [Afipia massiliensis]
MTTQGLSGAPPRSVMPVLAGIAVFSGLLLLGNRMLADPDTFWQIEIGKRILDSGSLPQRDVFSFTMQGQPWISTQWLAQVCFALAFSLAGWAGPVALTAASIALAFALVVRVLERHLDGTAVLVLLMMAFALASPHFLVRPHALAMPVMVAWTAALIAAADRGQAPRLWWLALMMLWANLHGSFVFGLALTGPIALDAVLNAPRLSRVRLMLRWVVFGVLALAASCLTPYGWNALLAARNILNLGDALLLITEWRPVDFSRFNTVEACLLLGVGIVLFKGLTLPPVRILLLLGLVHMALAHARNVTVLALLAPIVLAAPLAIWFPRSDPAWLSGVRPRVVAASAAVVLVALTAVAITMGRYAPPAGVGLAVAALKARGVSRVLNDYDFGGFLIAAGIPVAIDGRTELYGERFMIEFDRAMTLKSPATLFDVMDRYRIDATLLMPATPAVSLLDRLEGWERIYTDNAAVVHVRKPDAPVGYRIRSAESVRR